MDAMFSTLGMGTRYCLVSDDHERPEVYADEQERCPQTTLERFTDFDSVYDKFSRPAPSSSRREAELGRTLAGWRPGSGGGGAQQGKENTVPRAAADAVMTLFDRLAQRHGRAEISSFDRRFPLTRRGDQQPGSRLAEIDSSEDPFTWSDAEQYSETTPDWDMSERLNSALADASQWTPAPGTPPDLATPPAKAAAHKLAAPRPEQSCDQEVLIDLS